MNLVRRESPGGLWGRSIVEWTLAFVWALALWGGQPVWAAAGPGTEEVQDTAAAWLMDWFQEHGRLQGEIVGYGVVQRARNGAQNPANLILDVPRRIGAVEARPDLLLNGSRWEAALKPRWSAQWASWDQGRTEGRETDTEFFINEGWLRLEPARGLFVSYGRENLQWGPAYFLSPSNPFFRDNGRSNPKDEVDGMDFFRLEWTPSPSWTLSLMANTDKGRQDWMRDFEKTYAIKLDWTGYRRYLTAVVSKRENRRWHGGGYAGITASDALLIYGEVDLSFGHPGLYPEENGANPFGVELKASKKSDDALYPLVLLGGAYTLAQGPTVVAEYVYHAAGYDEAEADRFFHLIEAAAAAFGRPPPLGAAGAAVLGQSLDPGLRLLRRHYVMLQYQHMDLWRSLDLVVRGVVNADDGSLRFNPIVEGDLSGRMKWFLVGAQTVGSDWGGLRCRQHPNRTEFRRIGDYSFWAGLEFFF